MKVSSIIIFFFILPAALLPQQYSLRGIVTDIQTGNGLQYASIYTEGSSAYAFSGENGSFTITLKNDNVNIIFSHVGYKSETISAGRGDTALLKVSLTPVSYYLNAVSIYSDNPGGEKISSGELQNRQIQEYAGITKDALRSVQLLPGVSSNNEASANFNVRGGSYDENLVLINGVHVNEPFHLKEVENASVGIFNIDMTKKIEFSAGGFGAESGDALSSVLKIDFKEGNDENLRGKVNLSMVDLGAIAEGPLTPGSTYIVGVRRSYLTDMLKLAGAKGDFNISYYDLQGVLSFLLTRNNRLNLCLIYSADKFIKEPEIRDDRYTFSSYPRSERVRTFKQQTYYGAGDFSCSNMLASLSSVNLLSPYISNRISVSLYNEKTYNSGLVLRKDLYTFENRPDYLYRYSDSLSFLDDRFNKTFVFQLSFDFLLDRNNTLNTGINYERISYDVNKLDSRLEYFMSNLSAYPDTSMLVYPVDPQYGRQIVLKAPVNKYSFYIQDSWQLQNDLVLNAGLRYDYFDMNKKQTVSPRLSITYFPFTNFSIKAAYGIFYQTPNYRQLKYDYPSKNNTDNQKAAHYIIGADYRISSKLNLKLEGYIKKYENMIPVQMLGDGSLDYGSRENCASGYARGADVQLVSDFEWVNLRISYGYLTAKERLKGTDNYYSRYTDQTHTLASIIDFNLGKNWNASLRVFYGSGYAFPSTYLDRSVKPARWVTTTGGTKHLPAYEREDIRISKEFELYYRPLTVYLDVMNVLDKKNIVTTQYTYDRQGNPNSKEVDLFPIIPSIGVMYNF